MLSTITIVPRKDVQAVTEVVEDGERHFLGEQRDFRRHPALAEFLADTVRLGVAWVRLGPGQTLEPHRHPTRSMIVVCRGQGLLLDGDEQLPLNEGDIVLVPEGYPHGFRGLEPSGVEGLSLQFEGLGLYEDVENARVNFEKK
jgi:quercetin dioxygenase-like cupin family protein